MTIFILHIHNHQSIFSWLRTFKFNRMTRTFLPFVILLDVIEKLFYANEKNKDHFYGYLIYALVMSLDTGAEIIDGSMENGFRSASSSDNHMQKRCRFNHYIFGQCFLPRIVGNVNCSCSIISVHPRILSRDQLDDIEPTEEQLNSILSFRLAESYNSIP